MVRAIAALAVLVLCAGCTLSNLTPQSRFSDATYQVNDASRWGQLDLATAHVAPAYRPLFLARRAEWGERINIAEIEVVHMHIDRDRDQAFSIVNLSWTNDGITLRKSVLSQVWAMRRGTFRLTEETVKSGDEALFAR
jgi:hypothetical protein